MANVTVLEFTQRDPLTGEAVWPAVKSTTVATPGSVRTQPNTVLIAISADAACRMGMEQEASASSTPILLEIDREFITGSSTSETLNFIAEA